MTSILEHPDKLVAAARIKPDWWIERFLGIKLWQKQKDIALSVARNSRTAVRSCETAGKTCVAACIALWFLYNHRPATVLTTAPTFRQVSEILWREIAQRFNNALMPLDGNLTATRLELDNNWFALGLSTDEPVRFQGFHNQFVLVIVDEASGVPKTVYQAIENPLAAGHTRLLLIGNPTDTSGDFFSAFASEIYNTFHISAFDTPNFTSYGVTLDDVKSGVWPERMGATRLAVQDGAWINKLPYRTLIAPLRVEERLKEWGEGSFAFQCYILGEFPQSGVNNLFPISLIERAMKNELKVDEKERKVAAVDIARYGDDYTVFGLRHGNKVVVLEQWAHRDTMFTAGRVKRLSEEHKAVSVRVDSVGVGAGVADALKENGIRVEEINGGAKPLDTEQFLNLRAELYWNLLKKMQEGEIELPNDPALKAQLADVRYRYNSAGKLQIESKEDMRARGSKSPDKADVMMMLFKPVRARIEPVVVDW